MKSDCERRPRGTSKAETLTDVDWLSEFPTDREAANARFAILCFDPFPGDTRDELPAIESAQENSGSISPLTLLRLRATSRAASIGHRLSLLRNGAADFCRHMRLHAQRWELSISKRVQRCRLVLQAIVQDVRVNLRQRTRTINGWVVMRVVVGGIAALALLAVTSSSSRAPDVRSEPFELTSREATVATITTPPAMQPGSQAISAQQAPKRKSAKPPSAVAKPKVTPTKPPDYVGSLLVESDPSADVFINRTYVGTTPIELSNLRAGSHVVWLDRDGYDRWSGAVLVATGGSTRLAPKLHPTPRP